MNRDCGPLSRRQFLNHSTRRALALSALPSVALASVRARAADAALPEAVVDDPDGTLGRTRAPVAVPFTWGDPLRRAAAEGRLQLRTKESPAPVPAQLLPGEGAQPPRLCWIMPPGSPGQRTFALAESAAPAASALQAARDAASGQYDLSEAGKPVLRYNYATVEPGAVLDSIAPGNRMYAVARSNYIHPLFGPHGEPLTKDWSRDHPHHRGIYWAWPEVDWRGQRGDLHALQKVFARPTGKCVATRGPVFAQVDAENLWKWSDRDDIVRERSVIRVYQATSAGRLVDLEFHFSAIGDPVLLARRGAAHYGGLNVRLSAVQNQKILKHADPAGAQPRRAWGEVSGTFAGADQPAGLVILQQAGNPDYPGDWVEYPEINWLQPTFPASGTRYELKPGQTLRLRYRLWIHAGAAAGDDACAAQWRAYQRS